MSRARGLADALGRAREQAAPMSRRRFLGGALAAGIALGLAACRDGGSAGGTTETRSSQGGATAGRRRVDVAVVGGGLAGLTATYRLRAAGVEVALFEARERLGGRCFTSRDFFADGQTTEHGGQRIAPSHRAIRSLAEELGLELADVEGAERGDRYLVEMDGRALSEEEAYPGYYPFIWRCEALAEEVGWDWTPSGASELARELDDRTARDVLDELVEGGHRSTLGRSLELWLTSEYGLDSDRLSGLAVLDNFADPLAGEFRYEIRGGNDLLVDRLRERIGEAAIALGAPLEGLRQRSDGFALRLGDRPTDVLARRVVLALPFTTLRRVDLSGVELPSDKRRAIEELGMGTNAKLHLGLRRRVDELAAGWGGRFDAHTLGADGWSSVPHQPGRSDLLVVYTGGSAGASYPVGEAHGPPPPAVVERALGVLGVIAPGIAAAHDGRAWLDAWALDEWSIGSYSAPLPGQVTTLTGVAGRPEGGLVFAGEHTADESSGFLDGAVASGERAAREALSESDH